MADFSPSELNAVSAGIRSSGCLEVDMVTLEAFDGGGQSVLVRGDVTEGGSVCNVRALVVEGGVLGRANAPCTLASEGPVVIMGAVRFARIRAQAIYLGKGVRQCHLIADEELCVLGDAIDVEAHIGDRERLEKAIEAHRRDLAQGNEDRELLLQRIRFEKKRLNQLLHATGIVFNLNIGHIVRQEPDGLVINLTPFYNAIEGRSEDEIDQALKEFFAKAILGLLTRVNRRYISEGVGHRQRFATVIQKLQDLLMLTRDYDKWVTAVQYRETALWAQLTQTDQHMVRMAGGITPKFHLCFARVEKRETQEYGIKTFALSLRRGNGRTNDEVVLWRGETAIDLVFVPPDSMQQVVFSQNGERVVWKALSG